MSGLVDADEPLLEEHYVQNDEQNPLLNSLSSLQFQNHTDEYLPLEDSQNNENFLIPPNSRDKKRNLGTFAGVFCPVAMSMFSTLLFLRLGFVLGQAGLIQSVAMFLLAYFIMSLTILSICAISTNGAIEGGGAYFMISRALGPEFGGGIGLLFFLGQVVSCALYTSGLVEAMTTNFGNNGTLLPPTVSGLPISYLWKYLYSSLVLLFCLSISLVGAHIYGKTNVFTFFVVIFCGSSVVISMFIKEGSCENFSPENNISFWHLTNHSYGFNCSSSEAPYTSFNKFTFLDNIRASYQEDYSTEKIMNFAIVFAVLFSSVTGLMNGANMSGELKNPAKSIPRGTLGATYFTLGTFIIILFLVSATTSRELLLGNYNFFVRINIWPPFVAIGLFSATLSASLGNLIGGSRILYALAKDDIYGIFLRPATLATKSGNPVGAVFITWILVQLTLLIGSLNNIAPMCSELFLLAYAMTNLACLALVLTSAPNFRPMFKFFSSWTAFLGLVGCVVMCFFIHYIYALISISTLIVLVVALHLRGFQNSWGSISQALIFHQVRKYLLLLDSRKNHIKFWRPQILLMVANPRMSSQLIHFINDLKKSGLYVVGHVKVGSIDEEQVDPVQEELSVWISLVEKLKVKAFVEITLAPSVREGMEHLIRLSGLGGMKPNTVCFGFYDDSPPVDTLPRFTRRQRRGQVLRRPQISYENDLFQIFNDFRITKTFSPVDYVLMIKDAFKLGKNVCLFRNFHNLDLERLNLNTTKMYIDAWPFNFLNVDSNPVNFDKTCLFLLQLACVLHMVPKWRKHTILRIFACSRGSSNSAKVEAQLLEFLKILRIRAELKLVDIDEVREHMFLSSDVSSRSKPIFSDSYPHQVNSLISNQSYYSAVTFLYLPLPPEEELQQKKYLRQLDLLTQDLPPCVLVHGLQPVVCTSL